MALADACRAGICMFTPDSASIPSSSQSPASLAVIAAIKSLEDNPSTNSGTGSNLTTQGTVECDASIMDGTTGAFGAVGALSGVKNPICAAGKVMQNVIDGGPVSAVLGRIKPIVMVAEGAREWLKLNCSQDEKESLLVDSDSLVTPESTERWEHIAHYLQKQSSSNLDLPVLENEFEDTVGAVAMDCCGNIVSGVSSGGILFKYPGRIGEAASYGSGVWAQSVKLPENHLHVAVPSEAGSNSTTKIGAGCSLTGTGEQIMQTVMARTIGLSLLTSASNDLFEVNTGKTLETAIQQSFQQVSLLTMHNPELRNIGVLCLRVVTEKFSTESLGQQQETVCKEVWFAHTTQAMGIGWMSLGDNSPTVQISRKSPIVLPGQKRLWSDVENHPNHIIISGASL
ncbi:nucleophile aminohydrolase [Obelidium mucronatum]|nr:nucleophile aminohydrolase [Obelidium mucronatum]